MKPYKKILILSTIFVLFFAVSSSFYTKDDFSFIRVMDALAAEDENQEKESAKTPGEAATDPCPECPECPDPAKVVLRGLEDKKTRIEKLLKSQLQQKKELEIFEEQIDEKLASLNTLKKQIEDDLASIDKKKTQKEQNKQAEYEAKIGRLVKMYAGMKPKSAAQIVDKMKLEVAQEIFLRMREASASQILSFVDSERAAKISERLVFKKK